VFTDEDLQTALDVVGGIDLLLAAGVAVQTLALEYSAQGKSVKTVDLAIDLRSRGSDLMAVAKSFFEQSALVQQNEAAAYIAVAEPGGRTHDWGQNGIWTPWGNPFDWEWRI